MLIDKKEQRYYNIQTLHKFFALSSALLLASIIWIIKDDYSAEWKHWQREFLALEAAHPLKKTLLENSPIFQNKQSGEFPKETSPLKTVIASSIRDLPFLDFLNPSVKIEQTILGDFPFQLHFAEAKRVDRCTSCHVSLTEPRYMQQSNPLRPHPRTDLFVSFDSPHPAASFGCTICHQGRDRGTSFLSSAHSPNSGITATKWKKTYNWEPLDFWPYPMLPSKYIESSCLKCHQKQNFFEGGIKLSKGKKLIKKLGCRGCHRIPGEENFRKPGPSLRRIASKLNKEWVKSWIQNPGEWNKHANMPLFFPPGGPLSEKEISIKIDAIVEFLFHQSEKAPLLPVKKPGTPENGRKLFSAIGCTACHPDPEDEKGVPKDGFPAAPPLKNLKTKVTHEWLFSWLKSPERLDPTTLMPDFRLTDQEAADLTAYLLQSDDNTDPEAVLARDAQLSDAGKKTNSDTTEIPGVILGQELVSRYGCFGCHDIKGFNNTPPAGPDLTGVGTKALKHFDFGLVQNEIERSRHAWLFTKVGNPRAFNNKKTGSNEALIMPVYNLKPEETESIVTYLLGLTWEKIPEKRIRKLSAKEKIIKQALQVIEERRCPSCHVIDGQGGYIKNRQELSKKEFSHLLPPSLDGEGDMVQPQWLFSFLKDPTPVRPWLTIRMPTFAFQDNEVEALVQFFSLSSGRETLFDAEENRGDDKKEIESGKQIFTLLKCDSCHGGKTNGKMKPGDIGPDLSLAKHRLRAKWVKRWLEDPMSIKKGTRMPTNWIKVQRRGKTRYILPPSLQSILGGDVKKQISAVTAYLLTL